MEEKRENEDFNENGKKGEKNKIDKIGKRKMGWWSFMVADIKPQSKKENN